MTPLEPIGLLAIRRWRQGPQQVPVNRTAEQAAITATATAADWMLRVDGPRPYVITLDDLARATLVEDRLPINCVEGWSVGATWRGLSLLELVVRAGGGPDSTSGSSRWNGPAPSTPPRSADLSSAARCSPPI